jgi:hypothetical protein
LLSGVALPLLVALAFWPAPAIAQESAPAAGAPSGGSPAPGPQGAAPAAPAAPAQPEFKPPEPPRPSQTNVPGAFTFELPAIPTATYEFRQRYRLSEEYSDNFRLRAERSGEVEENFRTSLSAGFTLLMNTPKTLGSISTDLRVSHDTVDGGDDVSLFPSITALVRHTVDPRLSLTVRDTLTRSDDFGDSDEEVGIRGSERRTFTSNRFSLIADWLIDIIATQHYYRLSTFFSTRDTVSHVLGSNASMQILPRTTGRVGYEFSHSNSSGDTFRDSSSTGHLVFASVSRQIGQFASAGVSSSYSIQSRNDLRIWNISLFTAYGLPAGLSVSGSIGYSLLESDRGDRSTVSSSTEVSYRFARATVFAGYSQDFRQTFLEGEDFGVVLVRRYHAGVSFPAWATGIVRVEAIYSEAEFTGVGNTASDRDVQRIGIRGSVTTRLFNAGVRASYSENEVIGSVLTDRADHTFTTGANLGFQIFRWLSADLDYRYLVRSLINASQGDVTENRATVTLTAAF